MPEILILDPTSENAANVPLTLTTGAFCLLEHAYPAPDRRRQMAVKSEGQTIVSADPENRKVSLTIDVAGEAALATLDRKVAKLRVEGGTLQRTTPGGKVFVFDVIDVPSYEPSFDQSFNASGRSIARLELECLPYWRGTPTTYALRSETTLPVLVATETAVPGHVPALGRLRVADAQGVDQAWVTFGIQSRFFDPAATAGLFFMAESLTPLNGATSGAVTGASGGNAVTQATLTAAPLAVLSTTVGSTYLTHAGRFRVFARTLRPATNGGTVTLRLDWALGDLRTFTQNPAVSYAATDRTGAATWVLTDLGVIDIPREAQRWEGRLLASSTSPGDDVTIDYLFLVPVDEASGEATASAMQPPTTAYTHRDDFDHASGALTGKTLPVGGTWTFLTGDTDDFQIPIAPFGGRAIRVAVSDTAARLVAAGTATPSDVAVSAQVYLT